MKGDICDKGLNQYEAVNDIGEWMYPCLLLPVISSRFWIKKKNDEESNGRLLNYFSKDVIAIPS